MLNLRDKIFKTIDTCVRDSVTTLAKIEILTCTADNLDAFAADMTSTKCAQLTEQYNHGDGVWDHLKNLSASWELDHNALCGESSKLRELLDSRYKAVFTAFAVKVIISKSAKKYLPAAVDKAKQSLAFAVTHQVTLDYFIVDMLEKIMEGGKAE